MPPKEYQLALNWWKPLSVKEKSKIFHKYFSSGVTTLMDLTSSDIYKIYKSENI